MAFYLTIRQGDTPEDSMPIFASADPEIIELVGKSLARKLGSTATAKVPMLMNYPALWGGVIHY